MFLRGLGNREELACTRLMNAYAPLVLWCADGYGLHGEDGADVVQEVMLRVHRSFDKFRRTAPGASFRGWLWTLASHCSIDLIRRRTGPADRAIGGDANYDFLNAIPARDGYVVSEMPPPLDGSLHGTVESIRSEFGDRTWTAFWETTVVGRPAADVAEDLGMSAASVYAAKSRVLRRLRERLNEPTS